MLGRPMRGVGSNLLEEALVSSSTSVPPKSPAVAKPYDRSRSCSSGGDHSPQEEKSIEQQQHAVIKLRR
jgi:hypothetical protein